jgi:hypothetical protein
VAIHLWLVKEEEEEEEEEVASSSNAKLPGYGLGECFDLSC